jgi:NhaP-type Na+/H+ or K+/H+ antiporter
VPRRLAVAVALIVFSVCLICGMMAENTFVETVRRALIAMFVTLLVGLVIGSMGQKMLQENVKQLAKKQENSEKPQTKDR